jgi:hypothetical protein
LRDYRREYGGGQREVHEVAVAGEKSLAHLDRHTWNGLAHLKEQPR